MRCLRDVPTLIVAVLLVGAQPQAAQDQHATARGEPIAPEQGLAAGRATETGQAGPVDTDADPVQRRERSDSMCTVRYWEVLYQWHRDATRIP
jgi:hypothetical protein